MKLHVGYLLQTRLTYDPANPDAEWAIARVDGPYPKAVLVRRVPNGWEQIFAKREWVNYPETSEIGSAPYAFEELESATPVFEVPPHGVQSRMNWLIANKPDSSKNTTGKPYRAKPGRKCEKCGKQAVALLSAYSSGGTTSHVVEAFCKDCMAVGEPVNGSRICHICREPKADVLIHTVPHPFGKGPYDFRTHLNCVETIETRVQTRPTVEERRPQCRTIVTDPKLSQT